MRKVVSVFLYDGSELRLVSRENTYPDKLSYASSREKCRDSLSSLENNR